jgi:hypothetical protein
MENSEKKDYNKHVKIFRMTFSKIPKIKKLSQKERIGNIKNS